MYDCTYNGVSVFKGIVTLNESSKLPDYRCITPPLLNDELNLTSTKYKELSASKQVNQAWATVNFK